MEATLLAAAFACFGLSSAFAGSEFKGISKPFTTTYKQNGQVFKTIFSGNRARIESGDGSSTSYFIQDYKNDKLSIVFPDTKEFHEGPSPGQEHIFSPCGSHDKSVAEMKKSGMDMSQFPPMTCKKTGTATVAGRKVDKYESKMGEDVGSTIYFDPELSVVLKEEGPNVQLKVEITAVQTGGVPSSQFEVPSGFRKLSDEEVGPRALQDGQKKKAKK